MTGPRPPRGQSSRAHSSGGRRFEFITVSGGDVRTSQETRRRVHSHAQAEYRRRNPYQRRQTTVELDLTSLTDRPVQGIPGPATWLDASRSDPFQSFGLGDDRRAHRLWDHVYDGTCAKFRTLIAIGFVDLVRETIALAQLLSASAWHLVHWLQCEDDRGEDARYSMISTQSLQQRLNSLATGTSNEVVTAVLASAAYANLIKQPDLFQIHMDGLAQILRHRGGHQALDSVLALRTALFWIEVNGRWRQDAMPQYLPPYHILGPRSKLRFTETDVARLSSRESVTGLGESSVVKYASQQLKHLSEIVEAEAATRDLWSDPLFPVFHISPLLHDFLSIAHASVHDDLPLRQRECFRLAGLLYLCDMRSKFDFEPGSGMLYGTKLQLLLGTPGMLPRWEESNIFLLWALTVSACSPTLFDDLRNQFVVLLSESLRSAGLTTFQDFQAEIDGFLWCDTAFGQALRDLEHKLTFVE